jgi:hypothetical protein
MATTVFTPDRIFADLPQRTFDDYDSFERAFVAGFNVHRFDFPAGYGWRDALNWGLRRDLVRRQGRQVIVHLEGPSEADRAR